MQFKDVCLYLVSWSPEPVMRRYLLSFSLPSFLEQAQFTRDNGQRFPLGHHHKVASLPRLNLPALAVHQATFISPKGLFGSNKLLLNFSSFVLLLCG